MAKTIDEKVRKIDQNTALAQALHAEADIHEKREHRFAALIFRRAAQIADPWEMPVNDIVCKEPHLHAAIFLKNPRQKIPANPELAKRSYEEGEKYSKAKQHDLSLCFYSAALIANPGDDSIVLGILAKLYQQVKYEQAYKYAKAIPAIDKKDFNFRFQHAVMLSGMGKLDEALEKFRKLEGDRGYSKGEEFRFWYAKTCYTAKRYKKAEEQFKKLISMRARHDDYRYLNECITNNSSFSTNKKFMMEHLAVSSQLPGSAFFKKQMLAEFYYAWAAQCFVAKKFVTAKEKFVTAKNYADEVLEFLERNDLGEKDLKDRESLVYSAENLCKEVEKKLYYLKCGFEPSDDSFSPPSDDFTPPGEWKPS